MLKGFKRSLVVVVVLLLLLLDVKSSSNNIKKVKKNVREQVPKRNKKCYKQNKIVKSNQIMALNLNCFLIFLLIKALCDLLWPCIAFSWSFIAFLLSFMVFQWSVMAFSFFYSKILIFL